MQPWHRLFDDVPEWSGPMENVTGSLPRSLTGTLFRNGAVHATGADHVFDGDGMIRAVRMADGQAHYHSRYVDTHGRKVPGGRRASFGTLSGPWRLENPKKLFVRSNSSNTSVVQVNGKLYSLYEAGAPYTLDPDTLETFGQERFDGRLGHDDPFSAHPRVDPETGTLYNFGMVYGAGTSVSLWSLSTKGVLSKLRSVPLPRRLTNHDFVITPNYFVFYFGSATMGSDFWKLPLGLSTVVDLFDWDSTAPGLVVLVPRHGGEVQYIEAPACGIFHYAAAREHGQRVELDFARGVDPGGFQREFKNYRNSAVQVKPSELWRLTVDTESGQAESRRISDQPLEFPIVDNRHTYEDERPVYGTFVDPERLGLWTGVGVVRPDGSTHVHDFGVGRVCCEPTFVPKAPDAPADEGWLLTWVHRPDDGCSDFVVLDAGTLEPAYVGTVPVNAGLTFHGSYVPA